MRRKRYKNTVTKQDGGENRSLTERLGSFLDVPADLLCGGCYLELRGQSDLRLQGCRKILIYTDGEIVLRLRRGKVRVRGRRLVCTSYHAGCVEINGWISGVEFPESDDIGAEEV